MLGILYESFIHPVTILMSLPPASVGALLSLDLFRLVVSRVLTLFTIPVTYVYMERLSEWLSGTGRSRRPPLISRDHSLGPAGNYPRPATGHD